MAIYRWDMSEGQGICVTLILLHQTGHLPNKDKKLDSLRPGPREMGEGGRWEGQNFQQLKKVQRLEEKEVILLCEYVAIVC